MTDAVSADDTRKARNFIQGLGLLGKGVSPRRLAGASKELGKPLSETLATLADLMDAGQGQGPAPKTKDLG